VNIIITICEYEEFLGVKTKFYNFVACQECRIVYNNDPLGGSEEPPCPNCKSRNYVAMEIS